MCHFQNTLKNERLPLEGREIAAPPAGNLSSSETVRLQSAALPPHRHHPSETPRGLQSPEVTEPCGRGAGGELPPAGGLRPSRRPHADAPVSRGAAATSAYRAQKGRIGRCVDKNNLINFLTDRRRQNFSKQENLIHLHSAPGR